MSTSEKEKLMQALTQSTDIFAQAQIMQTLCTQHGYTQSSLAKQLGVSQSCVGNKIRLLQFTTDEQAYITEKKLSERHARALLRVSVPKREKLLHTVAQLGLTVQQTEELVEKYINNGTRETVGDFHGAYAPKDCISQIQATIDKYRLLGYKISSLTESDDSQIRITISIRK